MDDQNGRSSVGDSTKPVSDIYVKADRIVTSKLVRQRVTVRCDQFVTSKMDILRILFREMSHMNN